MPSKWGGVEVLALFSFLDHKGIFFTTDSMVCHSAHPRAVGSGEPVLEP